MAKGIGGDDGPSLWSFLTIILVWYWLRDAFKKAEHKVEDIFEIGKNSAGPLQSESTRDISAMQKSVDRIAVPPSRLKHPLAHYKAIADMIWHEMQAKVYTNKTLIFDALEPLSVVELKAVAKSFGVKESHFLWLTTHSVTIFKAFELEFTDGVVVQDLTRMRKIWAKTGLWF